MDAFLFTIGLFAFWGLVGFATIAVFPPRLRVIEGLLVSPAIGVAVTILPVFFINRAGIPVKDFGGILIPTLAVLSVIILAIKRPIFPAKKCIPLFCILLAALVLAAWPMFSYGFDWVSFANDDMANYCLAAQRFLNHGFFELPNTDDLLFGRDYSLAYWFMHVGSGARAGSDLMLSVVWSFFGLNAHQIFMPVIMALHLSLISATGSMVANIGLSMRAIGVSMGLMAISPLTTLGSLYQMIGQVGGLSLLCAALTLLYRPISTKSIARFALSNISASLILAALLIWYPEIIPFFVFGLGGYLLLLLKQKNKQQTVKVIKLALCVGLLSIIILNEYALESIKFMFTQTSTVNKSEVLLFPYLMVPSGLSNLWGLIPIGKYINEPWISIAIAASLLLFYWLISRVIPKQIRHVSKPVSMVIVMLAVGLFLFYRGNEYGLFKLAMFIQPFLIAIVAIHLASHNFLNTTYLNKITLLIVLITLVISQNFYVKVSVGKILGSFTEIPLASSLKINKQFASFIKFIKETKDPNKIAIIPETSLVTLAKFYSLYTKNITIYYPQKNFYYNILLHARSHKDKIIAARAEQYATRQIDESNEIEVLDIKLLKNREIIYVSSFIKQDIFNSFNRQDDIISDNFMENNNPKNHLQFIHSKLGNHYNNFGSSKKIAFYQLESDPSNPGRNFSALGRNIVFKVIGPTKKTRIVMELTDTVLKQFSSKLPKPKVQHNMLNFVGRGSGRVFSNPIEPKYIDGTPYILIDMGREVRQFSRTITGLNLLYGRKLLMDPRNVSTFGRDISLLSEEEYQNLQPPACLSDFPADLNNRHLEYSGIYEDGWISEQSFFVLSSNIDSKFLVLSGFIPQIKNPQFSSLLKISVNGEEVAQQKIKIGNFELKIPIQATEKRQHIDISFTDYQKLPGDDGRIVGAKMEYIGFSDN